jgi:hypothetical protein
VSLTPTQRSIIARAQASGGGELGLGLDDEQCAYLVALIGKDMGILLELPNAPAEADVREFFSDDSPSGLRLPGFPFVPGFEDLLSHDAAAETYFACLAALQRQRLKYERILQTQPLPTMDHVGPRALLQYGSIPPPSLAAFLFWRKWLFDIDNRAGQETGYLFEPIIAAAIGGVPFSSTKSPVRRRSNPSKGRQVDCVRTVDGGQWAYEFKLRVTIAASGQGRWREELDFPDDCRSSGLRPVLIVLDPTPNEKLDELVRAFKSNHGDAYLGDKAWAHLESAAGDTMARFLERYVREPIQRVLEGAPSDAEELPDLHLSMGRETFTATIGTDVLVIARTPEAGYPGETDEDEGTAEELAP